MKKLLPEVIFGHSIPTGQPTHNKLQKIVKKIVIVVVFIFWASALQAATYYVATTGSDSNSGTQTQPFRNIQKAADIVNPGDTVIVQNGVYTDSDGNGIVAYLRRGGTSTSWVTFKSANPWGAKLDGQNNAVETGWHFSAGYVRVEGFEISGFSGHAAYGSANNLQIVGNHIHNIGRYCTDTVYGRDGYYGTVSNVTFERNLIHDIGRYSPGENGCNPTTTYYQNLDHGLYFDGGSNLVIKNNIFYNIKHGWPIHVYPNTVSNMKILNNTFAFPNPYRDAHIILAAPISNSVIANNVFYQPGTGAITTCCGYSASNLTVNNNIVYAGTIATSGTGGLTASNNFNNTDPELINPAAFDFRLQSNAPGVNAGAALSEVTTDYDGVARPQGGAFDIGAYEFVGGTTLPAPSNLAVSP